MPLPLGLVQLCVNLNVRVNLSPLPQIMVEHDVFVLTWALQRGMDFAHRHEISPVFRVASSRYLYPSQIILLFLPQKHLYFII